MRKMSDLTIGFVGLGNMGTPMATRLVEAGHRVQAYDVSADARARLAAAGATDARDLGTAVSGADIVILMLPDSKIVTAVVEDAGFVPSIAAGTIVVDMSSSEPLRTRELAKELAGSGIHMVDAPVSGGVKGAVGGSLTIMVGGSDEDVAVVTPVLSALGKPVHAGPIGSGDAIKALNNLLSATHLWVTSEAMIAGEKFGLDPEVMLTVFNGSSGRSGSTENKWPNFILPETYNSGFGLRLMLKDMRIAVQLAEQAGAPSRLGADAVALWAEAADGLEPAADHTEIAKWIKSSDPEGELSMTR
jgi:3-hydroxyisobutyrate dehydrogenase